MGISSNNQTKINDQVDVFIFCSGLGTRMYPYSKKIPKPLLPLMDGTYTLLHIIKNLCYLGFDSALANYSYGKEYFLRAQERVKEEYCFQLDLLEESVPLGHAGGLKNAEILLNKDIILGLNGDTLSQITIKPLKEMINMCNESTPMVVWGSRDSDNTPIRIDKKGVILGVGKWNVFPGETRNQCDATGVVLLHHSALRYVKKSEFLGFFGLDDLLARINEDGKKGIVYFSERELLQVSIGTKEEYEYYLDNPI